MLEVINLKKTYYNKTNQVLALNGVSLNFGSTGLVVVSGESGNGKSSLFNIVAGIESWDEGEVVFDGVKLSELNKKEFNAYRNKFVRLIFDDYNLIPSLSIIDNLKLANQIGGHNPTNEECEKVLEEVGLKEYAKRMPNELSSGQKQKISIARAVLGQPKVLLLDEPTARLDEDNTNKVWKILKKISKNTLVLAITHKESIINKYADRVIKLKEGKVIKDEMQSKKALKESYSPVKRETFNKKHITAGATAKLALTNFSVSKFKTIFTIILSCISLIFFSLFFIAQSYNESATLAEAIKKNDANIMLLVKKDSTAVSAKDYASLANETGVHNFSKVINYESQLTFGENYYYSNLPSAEFTSLIEMASINNVGVNNLGQEFIGNYPTNVGEIAISDYIANLIVKFGVRDASNNLIKPENMQQLLNKLIKYNNQTVKISAIYLTDFADYVNEDLSVKEDCKQMFEYNLKNSYSVVHVYEGYVQTMCLAVNKIENANLTICAVKPPHNQQAYIKPISSKFTITCNAPTNYYLPSGQTLATALDDGTAILPISLYNNLFGTNLRASEIVNLEDTDFNSVFNQIKVNMPNGDERVFNVVGLCENDYIYINSTTMQQNTLVNGKSVSCVAMQSIYTTSALALSSQLLASEDLTEIIAKSLSNFDVNTFYSEKVINFSNKLEVFKDVILAVSIVMLLFAIALIYNFIYQIIDYRKHDIGILRCFGATALDLISVLALTSVIFVAATYLISTIFTLITTAIANSVASSAIGFKFAVFTLNSPVFAWLLLACVVVVAISSLVPVLTYNKKYSMQVFKRF